MNTFFPHLYEYNKVINLLNDYENNETDEKQLTRKRRFVEASLTKYFPAPRDNSLSFNQSRQSKDIDFLIYLEIKAQKLRESDYNPFKFYNASLNEILKERTELSNINRYQKPLEWPQSPEIHVSQYLAKCFSSKRHWMIIDFVLCVEIAKILPFFGKLNFEDQKELIKSITLVNALFTQAYYSFTFACDAVIFPDGSVPSMFFTQRHSIKNEIFERIVEPIKRIKMTKEEYVLLKAIIFCSSKSETISVEGKEILEVEFQKYSKILLNFLQSKYGNAPGAVRYSQILSVMEAMTYFTQKAKEFYFFMGAINNPTFPAHSPYGLVKQIIL